MMLKCDFVSMFTWFLVGHLPKQITYATASYREITHRYESRQRVLVFNHVGGLCVWVLGRSGEELMKWETAFGVRREKNNEKWARKCMWFNLAARWQCFNFRFLLCLAKLIISWAGIAEWTVVVGVKVTVRKSELLWCWTGWHRSSISFHVLVPGEHVLCWLYMCVAVEWLYEWQFER